MKSTGIVRKVDELGRIVIPIELRRTYNINEKDKLEIYTEGDCILLKKHLQSCIFCGSTIKIKSFKDKIICQNCIEDSIKL